MSNIKSGKIRKPIITKHDQTYFEGSFVKNNFKIVLVEELARREKAK